jgi:hypothetical protein
MAIPFMKSRAAKPQRSAGADALAFTTGLVFGALVGATAAILFAPTDGETLRHNLVARLKTLLGGRPAAAPPAPSEMTSATPSAPAEAVPAAAAAGG